MTLAAGKRVGAIAARAQIPETHLLPGELALQEGLHPAIVLHAIGQAVAEQRDDLPFF
jgi:hypothetical protein